MEEIVMSKGGFDIKALTNGAEIDAFQQLQVYKAQETKSAAGKLVGALVYCSDAETKRRKTGKA